MLRVTQQCLVLRLKPYCLRKTLQTYAYSVFPSAQAMEQPCSVPTIPPFSEPIVEPCVMTEVRSRLCHENAQLFSNPPVIPVTVGNAQYDSDQRRMQPMPFDHHRAAAYYSVTPVDTIKEAALHATQCQQQWEHRPIDERCSVFENAARLISTKHRQRITAAAMIGQAMTAIQAEHNICQLVDYMRYGSIFMRDLTKSRCVVDGGQEAFNRNQYHGLEGFWAAITPSDSLSHACRLVITPALMGNAVVWKPSDSSVLACHRIFECLQIAGLPPGVINFVPADKDVFLDTVCSDPNLAGISFGGTTSTLEHIWKTVGERIQMYNRFPRIVGTGSGKNFHVVHSTASLANAVSCTVRAAFEMAGQKSSSCSRVYVAESLLTPFLTSLYNVTKSLRVCLPLDYRCFTSSLLSKTAYDKVVDCMKRAAEDDTVKVLCGGRSDDTVGYFVEPTVYLVSNPLHDLLRHEIRGPLLTVHSFPDDDGVYLQQALAASPCAISGSIFAQDLAWTRWAVSALHNYSTTLYVNDRCSEERPAQQSVGGTRKSGTGAKAGSISYLLHFGDERSVRESLRPSSAVHYKYMDQPAPEIFT